MTEYFIRLQRKGPALIIGVEFKDFATLDQGHPFYRTLGLDGVAKFNQKLVGVVTHFEREIIRYNPALSFRTAPAPAP